MSRVRLLEAGAFDDALDALFQRQLKTTFDAAHQVRSSASPRDDEEARQHRSARDHTDTWAIWFQKARRMVEEHLLHRDWDLEASCLMRFLVFRFGLLATGASYGDALQDLHRGTSQRKIATMALRPLGPVRARAHGLLTIGVDYVARRFDRHVIQEAWGARPTTSRERLAYDLYQTWQKWWSTLAFLHFLLFLYEGRYRTLLDRLLRIRFAPRHRHSERLVSNEALNRQVIWTVLYEVAPMLPLHEVEAMVRPVLRRTWALTKGRRQRTPPAAALPAECCPLCAIEQQSDQLRGTSSTSIFRDDAAATAAAAAAQDEDGSPSSSRGSSGSGTAPIPCDPVVATCGCTYCSLCLRRHVSMKTVTAEGIILEETRPMVPSAKTHLGGIGDGGNVLRHVLEFPLFAAFSGSHEKGSPTRTISPGWPCLRCGKTLISATKTIPDLSVTY